MVPLLRRLSLPLPASIAAACLMASVMAPVVATAEPAATTMERQVKAAFLYKFSGYVEWPLASFPRPESPILIGVAGDDRLANDLARMTAARTTGSHPITVLRVDKDSRPKNLHILFVSGAESERIGEWADLIRGAPVLLVTDSEGALDHGSMINFVSSEGRIRFEVALTPALASGLRLSSGLLAVAKTVLPAAQ